MRSEIKAGRYDCHENPNSKYRDDLYCCNCDGQCIWSTEMQCQADCARETNCVHG